MTRQSRLGRVMWPFKQLVYDSPAGEMTTYVLTVQNCAPRRSRSRAGQVTRHRQTGNVRASDGQAGYGELLQEQFSPCCDCPREPLGEPPASAPARRSALIGQQPARDICRPRGVSPQPMAVLESARLQAWNDGESGKQNLAGLTFQTAAFSRLTNFSAVDREAPSRPPGKHAGRQAGNPHHPS